MIARPTPDSTTRAPRGRLRLILLADHVRLPGRFFGRLTAAIQAGL